MLEFKNKELEYKYKMGQISDNDFITEFTNTAAEKQDIQQQYDTAKAKIEACSGTLPRPLGLRDACHFKKYNFFIQITNKSLLINLKKLYLQ